MGYASAKHNFKCENNLVIIFGALTHSRQSRIYSVLNFFISTIKYHILNMLLIKRDINQ